MHPRSLIWEEGKGGGRPVAVGTAAATPRPAGGPSSPSAPPPARLMPPRTAAPAPRTPPAAEWGRGWPPPRAPNEPFGPQPIGCRTGDDPPVGKRRGSFSAQRRPTSPSNARRLRQAAQKDENEPARPLENWGGPGMSRNRSFRRLENTENA